MKVLETVTRRRPPAKDRHGDPVGDPIDHDIARVRVAPRDSRENVDRANSVVTAFTLLLPQDLPDDLLPAALPTDLFFVRGKWRDVEGEPFDAGRKGILVSVTGGTG